MKNPRVESHCPAGDERSVGAGLIDEPLDLVECAPVDDRAHEVAEVLDVAHLDLVDHRDDPVAHLRPERSRHIHPADGRAFLTLELIAAPHDRDRQGGRIGRRVSDHEVLAAGLADDARVGTVRGHRGADRLPHGVEDAGAAGEVDPGEIPMGEQLVRDHRRVAGDEIDDTGRQAGLSQQRHHVVRREHRARRRLPDDGVAHQRRCGGQVGGDRGEVERRDGVDEPFERAVLELVPHRVIAGRLLVEQLLAVVRVEPPEIDDLAGRIDLRLEHRLRLAQHRRGVDGVAPGRGQQLRGLEEDRGAVVERPGRTSSDAPHARRRRPGGCAAGVAR